MLTPSEADYSSARAHLATHAKSSLPVRALRGARLVVLCLVPVAAAAAATFAAGGPIILYNPSPSVPKGWYLRSFDRVAVGALVAFHVPALGQDYARANIPYLVRGSIIKPLVAGQGDHVCTVGDLKINGRLVGGIKEHGSSGHRLPHWNGCRRLNAGEFFAISTRIPQSFDSRYYGPIMGADIIGTYRPVWTW